MSPAEGTVLFLRDVEVRSVFDWSAAIAALRRAYQTPALPAMSPPRTVASAPGVWLRTMSAISADQAIMGTKNIAVSLIDRRASYLISIFDGKTGVLRALLDGNAITGYRTAATTALAIDALAPGAALRVGLIGTGFEAGHHLEALAAVRPLSRVTVYSPNPASRDRFIAARPHFGCPIEAAPSGEAAVRDVDVVICAARSRDETPIFYASWLTREAVVASIGSTSPDQREIDVDVIERAHLIVADMPDEVANDTGDLLAAREAGVHAGDRIAALADLIAGRIELETLGGLRLYKSVGSAVQDLAVAAMCVERAAERGAGTLLSNAVLPVQK